MPISAFPFGPPWAMADRDALHCGRSNAIGPEDPSVLGTPWPFRTNGPIFGSAVVDYSGTAYVGSVDGWLHSVGFSGRGGPIYDAGSPTRVTPALVSDPPHPHEGTQNWASAIYFGADDGRLHSVLPSGQSRWVITPGVQKPNGSAIRSSATVIRGPGGLSRVYAATDGGVLYAVTELAGGSAVTMWERKCAAPLRTAPALSPAGDVVYVGAPDGRLHAWNAYTGKPLSGSPVTVAKDPIMDPVVTPSGTIILASRDGTVRAYDAGLHGLWKASLGGRILAAPALGLDGEVLIIAHDVLFALDRNGTRLWEEPFPGHRAGRAAPAVDAAGTVIVATDDGWVIGVRRHPIAAGVRQAWAVEVDPATPDLGSPTMDAHGRIYVPATDSLLYVIDEIPAFQLAFDSDLASAGNTDVYTLREIYSVEDPARRLRLTEGAAADIQPAYSHDRSVLGFVSQVTGSPDAFLATALGTDAQNLSGPLPATAAEKDPAFSPVSDLTGAPRPPHNIPYLAVTSDASGSERLLFIDLKAQAAGKIVQHSFTDWASSIGVPPAIRADLEPPHTSQSQAAFAPDGRKVAWRHCDHHSGTGELRVLIFDSSGWRITSVGPPYIPDPESALPCLDEPCFSPDSRWIALRDRVTIAVYDILHQLAPVFAKAPTPLAEPAHPSWSPDGTEIAVGLATPTGTDLYVASEAGYKNFVALTASRTSDQPFYHYFKMPAPQIRAISPDRQVPDSTVEIHGRGFDILHRENNLVLFTDTQRGQLRPAQVLSAAVNPYLGLGVLTVRVPKLAGHGPVTVETRFGSATSADFHVLPQATRMVQARSVPGARIRVFGNGFDLSPANANTVAFTAAAGGTIPATAMSGDVIGNEEYLVVEVPSGMAESGPIRVDNAYGGNASTAVFTQLHPSVSLVRTVDTGPTTGLPEYALQGSAGVPVRLAGANFPYDPFFNQGTTMAAVDAIALAAPAAAPIRIRTPGFTATGPDTAGFGPGVFPFPGLGPTHPGGELVIHATDTNLIAAHASTPFRVPLTNIPIIFVPGTSGASLDLAPGTPTPLLIGQPADTHSFPWLCKLCPPGSNPWTMIAHIPRTISYDPATSNITPFPHPGDPRGARVWLGPEAVSDLIGGQAFFNQGNHYLDAIAFTPAGVPARPEIVPGTVLRDVLAVPPPFSGNPGWGFIPVYEPVLSFLTSPNPALDWPGRPLCTSGATGPCVNADGSSARAANAVYLFNLDWRDGVPAEQARLNAFVDAVLARSDVPVKKVVLVTHSYGALVARAYYLNPANAAGTKVDQVISFGGGFGGVVQPLDVLERGSSWGSGTGIAGLIVGLPVGIAEWETEALAQNWPTAYFQQPNSESWFADHDLSKGINRAYIRDHRLLIGAGELTTWAASTAWVASRHNATLVGAQRGFFSPAGAPPVQLENFTGGTGDIYHHRIMGNGRMNTTVATVVTLAPSLCVGTPVGALLASEWVPTEWKWPVYSDGDSTIPYHGALGLTDPRDDRVYVISGVVHGDLPNVPEAIGSPGSPSVKGLLQLLIEGSVCSQPQAPQTFRSQNQVTENVGGSVIPALEFAAETSPDRWLMQVRGAADIVVEDADGRRVGPARGDHSGIIDLDIPGASYTSGEAFSSVFVNQPGSFTVTLTAAVSHKVNVYLSLFNEIGRFCTYFFRRVPVSKSGLTRLRFDPASQGELRFISEHPDGGSPVPTAGTRLTGAACDVTQPPTTRVEVVDGKIRVTAHPAVQDCPVARSYVTTDGVTHAEYHEPLLVPPDAKLVMAYSEDVAGNVEYPGAVLPVLELSTSEVRLEPGSEVAAVEVRNPDPLGVTHELKCHAAADADWLAVEPSSGTTPFQLRVRLTREVGSHRTARIHVRTSNAGAVVAEQTLSVVFDAADDHPDLPPDVDLAPVPPA